jgi:hypothetical protein
MLLEASNWCLHLSGQDINPTLCKIAAINGWLYMPSLVMPCKEIAVGQELKIDRKLKTVLKKEGALYDQL